MAGRIELIDYYFEDKAPDGWYEYHLLAIAQATPELYRDDKPIREILDPTVAKESRLLEDMVFRVLEHFVRNAGQTLRRLQDFDEFGDIQPYLGRIRKIFDDTEEPHRVIKKAGKGGLVFAPKVRNTPSLYRAMYRTELRQHWKPHAMGSGALFQGGHWYFSGRTHVLRHTIEWLSQPSSGGVARVVTGAPGSGKSAVLGYLVTCSDEQEIREPTLAAFLSAMPEGTVPAAGKLDFAIDLRDRTVATTLGILADFIRCEADDVVKVLANRQTKTVLVFDALEEAAEPIQIAEVLLRPLTGYNHLWILIGSRRPELPRLGNGTIGLDLDAPDFQVASDVALYVERILMAPDETRNSPYRDNPAVARRAAEAVAWASRGNFLVAFIVARLLVEGQSLIDPDKERLPRTPEEAFNEYLTRLGERSGLGYARLRRALIPIAYAQGEGLPREVWNYLANADVDGILESAAAFIPEYREDGYLVYRLYHHALSEALREPSHEKAEHKTIATRLIAAIPEHDWLQSDWYTAKYLAAHAAAASMLDALVLDTRFLAVADPVSLIRVADAAQSPDAQRRVHWYKQTLDRLVLHSDIGERLSYLELVARQQGADDLADTTSFWKLKKWSTSWAKWTSETPQLILRGHNNTVEAVAVDDDGIVSASSDQTIRLWNRRTGSPIGQPIHGHDGAVLALALNKNIVVSGSADMTVRLWDRTAAEAIGEPLRGHRAPVRAVAMSDDVVVSGGDDGIVWLWDINQGPQRTYAAPTYLDGVPLRAERGIRAKVIQPVAKITSVAIHGEFVAFASEDGYVFIWNTIYDDIVAFSPYANGPVYGPRPSIPADVVLCENARVCRIDGDTPLLANHFRALLVIFRHFRYRVLSYFDKEAGTVTTKVQ